jgi:putative addiction module component (TIGR02574 family)
MTTYAEILSAALSLPEQQRTELADVLLASTDLDDAKFEISPEWREEIARRGAAYERGELKGRPWEEFEAEIRRKYEDDA